MAHSLASAPLLAKKTFPSPTDQPVQCRRYLRAGQGTEKIGRVQQRAGGAAHRLGHRGVGVAERSYRQPGQEIEVAPPFFVPQVRALAAHERNAGHGVGRHQVTHAVTMVPIPLRVKNSSTSA